ncbi:alpha/beta fold hydrolase [Agromyces aurantiacus]|uniref:Alpha/beta fold hydrolase n=1 Tax=Agromyces aurantiacus TaxID=165814 RepID=A0ABV9RAV4_9MICO|nr:alpha/beta hydrolase [Agromyces aurantiacus]MBM7505360.1 pimeloyl-ACP methyl ester carboxylesterase [Agromyces aurantiacus]
MTPPALNVLERGSGTPLLALHGFPVDHRLMSGCLEPVFDADEPIRRIYPDLPGLGASPGDGVSSTRDVLDRVDAFVDESIGDEPFLLVGESYGGYLSRALVQRRREQVLGLALVCPSVVADAAGRRLPARVVRRPDPDLVAGLEPAEAAEYTDVAVVESPETLDRFRAEVAPGLASGDPDAIARIRAAYGLDEPIEQGAPYTAPTLVLAGRQDWIVGYLDQWDLVERYPAATFAVLDVAGHNLQFERPELFRALVRDWLDRVASEPRR